MGNHGGGVELEAIAGTDVGSVDYLAYKWVEGKDLLSLLRLIGIA